jgi:uncharacterized protein YjbJ (UPF0337 family)
MNTTTIKGNWNVTKGKLKQQYAQLTDDDLIYTVGKEDELLGRIQKRTGRSREEIASFLSDECECDFAPEEPPGAERDARGRSFLPDSSANQRRSPSSASFKR